MHPTRQTHPDHHRYRRHRCFQALDPNTSHTLKAIVFLFALACLLNHSPVQQAQALVCKCNECHEDRCTTSEHSESNCFKSVERLVENNTYVWAERYGCISGSDGSIAALQCKVDRSLFLGQKEPQLMVCCNDVDFCNRDIPDPNEDDDPRWREVAPVIPNLPAPSSNQASSLPIVVEIIYITCLAVLIISLLYKGLLALQLRLSEKKKNSIDSRDSDSAEYRINFDETPKSQYANHHNYTASSSASTHTYTISDYLSQKPTAPYGYEHSIASIEHTSTLPDLTSGVGTRLLEPRTMARVVDSGKTVPVGSGRFGRVFQGTYHGEDVAVKAFKTIDHESWQREENILRKLNHENIVRYIASETYSVAIHETEIWMFLEFCPHGSLCDFLDSNEICGPQQAIKILYSIIKGLSYLHEDYSTGYKPPIAHRDIKSKNILMRTPETCCLADFGHAVIRVNEKTLDFGGYDRLQVGTIRYLAPEILKPSEGLDHTQFHTFARADLYQFGLVLWEVCNRTALDVLHPVEHHRLPYDERVPQNPSLSDMIRIVCDENYRPPRSPDWLRHPMMKELSSLMEECWRPKPNARMETLGVKKRLSELYNQSIPQSMFYHNNIVDTFSSASDCQIRSKTTDRTL